MRAPGAETMREGRPLPPMLHGWADTWLRVAIPSASALELPAARDLGCGRRSQAGCCPAMHSSSAVPPAPRGRPPDVCSLTGSPCSITTLARTPCVLCSQSGSPLPVGVATATLSPLPRQHHLVLISLVAHGGLWYLLGTFRAIPPYLFGQPLPSRSSARRQETARATRSPRTPAPPPRRCWLVGRLQ